ncbi:bifunctional protein-serine/threonine kinase/phosphatase [Marinimicrobium sp. ABcell2]|uniref:bifunctional protein-serine/threonine kinase/phosphatase n=1 Tax=Marinimicrobium sp. ABcell2 TaxID=3069751 RepID=UPI0027B2BF55|nr:bifunctional protein-serine/threonine kinase/phosphatase [Marinimicrobium sp. ABcell2]MDQ2076006.1 bifunctional protein-serine/threonine kinase/phosphatase [Marinimicrobium sp. ABcell2]
MSASLTVDLGQHSSAGRKPRNQDFHGACLPEKPQLTTKGIALALADGISSSDVSHIASQAAVGSFLEDYYCTPETWSVKQSAQRVLMATNSWLYGQTSRSPYRFEKDRGYVCTLSAIVLKGRSAHLFHIGDARIYRRQGEKLEPLTQDHRYWLSQDESLLSRAMGVKQHLEVDYQRLSLEPKDTFVLATDGVYEFCSEAFMVQTIDDHSDDLDTAAQVIVEHALAQGSDDNLTVQIARVLSLPEGTGAVQDLIELPPPPLLDQGKTLDGYQILRKLHASSRSHVYLAKDSLTGEKLVLKTLSTELQDDPRQVERFLTEEWIARRIDSPHVARPQNSERPRTCLYTVMEYLEGRTLTQWLRDNPHPSINQVRDIVGQVAQGLRAFHRLEMLHQDLRPANIMIDDSGTVKIIDFGSARVAGILEIGAHPDSEALLGTAQYTAPEYFVGGHISPASDLFSLAVIAYQMLTGNMPYGTQVAKKRTRAAQLKLSYRSALPANPELPFWMDEVLKKALHPNPFKRYGELSEFVVELRRPDPAMLNKARPPLLERNPVLFWQGTSLLLAGALVASLAMPYL